MLGFRKLIGVVLLTAMFLFSVKVEATELVILHTNDIHARVLDTDDRGRSTSLAWIVAAVKKIKAQNSDSLWLDAGDTFHGMPAINISKGENMLTLLNKSGINAMVPGNHDFNYGIDQLIKLEKQAKFDIIDANLAYKRNNKLILPPYKIYTLPNDLKVGVFGITTPDTQYKARPKLVKDLKFLDPVEISKNIVNELRPKCDILIAVTHLGVDESSKFTSISVAKEVDGIDLIVDGHSHTVLPSGLTIGNTLIVQTGCHAYNLGKVTFDIENHRVMNKQAELLNKETIKEIAGKEDQSIINAINEIEKKNEKILSQVVGENSKFLSGDRATMRTQETELGDFVADSFRAYADADFSVANGGTIRSDLPAGKVTWGDVISIFPFGNQLQLAEIKGTTVREMLEYSVSAYPEQFAGFLQVSGIRFTFDPSKPIGSRVSDIYVNDKPLDDNQVYKMATTDFLLQGGDGYTYLKELSIIGEYDTCEKVFKDYIAKVDTSNIKTGRIMKK